MPSVFLSYARSDLPLVEQLVAQLKEAPDILVWRDQEKIYGGQKWPKVIGEAIAAQDWFLLAWSKAAADSHFVEFEWNTAIALKKTIIPCLLDTTPLPASLTADQAIDAQEPSAASASILKALQAEPSKVDAAHASAVIGRLGGITATKEKEVVKEAEAIFAEQQWTVRGNVYQAENIYIIGEPASKSGHVEAPEKVEKASWKNGKFGRCLQRLC